MNSSYKPIKKNHADWVKQHFNCDLPEQHWDDEISPTQFAPFIYIDENKLIKCTLAQFGLIPFVTREERSGRRTYNARSETVAEEASYKNVWKERKFGLALMESYFGPVWENGLSKRWSVKRVDLQPIAAPSIWERLVNEKTGEVSFSFSLLTINADQDPIMKLFHKEATEKRSIVVLDASEYNLWLNANHIEARALLKLAPNNILIAEPSTR